MDLRRRVGCAVLAAVATGWAVLSLVAPGSGAALGPVVAVTPSMTNPPAARGSEPVLSNRGEVVAVVDHKTSGLDDVEPPHDVFFVDQPSHALATALHGDDVAISGNGCVGVVTGFEATTRTVVFPNLCSGGLAAPRLLLDTTQLILSNPVLSHDGRFLAAEALRGELSFIVLLDTTGSRIEPQDIDTRVRFMPIPAHFPGQVPNGDLGIDISDAGNVVVATFRQPVVLLQAQVPATSDDSENGLFVALWDVTNGVSSIVSPLTSSSAYPSVSGDGRSVSYASFAAPPRAAQGSGPWIYVAGIGAVRVVGGVPQHEIRPPVLISGTGQSATYTTMSRDATQLAYALLPKVCNSANATFLLLGQTRCRPDRIEVAHTGVPGFGGPVGREIVVATGQGVNAQPALSGNGRWIAWRSTAGDELVGAGGLKGLEHVFMRRRDAAMAVSAIDFGQVPRGTSATATATVSNTGVSTVSVDTATTTSGAFAVVAGGTCVLGATTLPPGGTCTISVRFDAQNPGGQVSASLDVREVGFDAVAASGSLNANVPTASTPPGTPPGTTLPPATTPTTVPPRPTTTTAPATTTSTTSTTTTTTEPPRVVELSATPNPLDFGVVTVGVPSPPATVTVTNSGDGAGVVSVSVTGEHAADFAVVGDTCSGQELAAGASCTIEVITRPAGGGVRTALLTVLAGSAALEVPLLAESHFEPRIVTSPTAVTARGITIVVGQGFPPFEPVLVEIAAADTAFTAHPDGTGTFRLPISPLGTLALGSHRVRVAERPGFFPAVEGTLVVVLPTFEPHGPNGPIFGSDLIVSRGR